MDNQTIGDVQNAVNPQTTPPADPPTNPPADPPKPESAPASEPKTETPPPPAKPSSILDEGDLDLNLPEGADEELITAFKSVAKEAGLRGAHAQKIVDAHQAAQKRAEEAAQARWAETQTKWQEELRTDKDFGGANFSKNVSLANRALERFGGSELIEFLKDTGLSNHPNIVRAFMRVGVEMANDSIAGASAPPAQKKQYENPLYAIYDNTPDE